MVKSDSLSPFHPIKNQVWKPN